MTFLDSIRAMADGARSIAGPSGLGVRLNQLTVRTRTWQGGRLGLGPTADVDLVLPQKYPVRHITAQEIFSSGGKYEAGDIAVDHVTPNTGDGTVGFTADQLNPTVTSNAVEIIYIITGAHPGEYTLIDIQNYRVVSTRLVLRRRA